MSKKSSGPENLAGGRSDLAAAVYGTLMELGIDGEVEGSKFTAWFSKLRGASLAGKIQRRASWSSERATPLAHVTKADLRFLCHARGGVIVVEKKNKNADIAVFYYVDSASRNKDWQDLQAHKG